LLGIGIAALISALVPDDLIVRHLGSGWVSLSLMLLVSVPLYICATASTPIAAALVFKGLTPGAALVFLLAGPATNAATITIVTRHWGRQAACLYLAAIASCSLTLGWLVDYLYDWWDIDITRWVHAGSTDRIGIWSIVSALLLLVLILRAYWPGRGEGTGNGTCN
jgi:hypothetical protein